ncbi:phosphoribosyl-ATP diphosphatase [Parachitinimonas caeni]|uniref:Phosphoribosyl-ATP pyrophosphatase n=1 Tax=Parachitinimonas caeni TaxID=3031301 RepID=A0ABT7DVL9_9NEIS|nr:phosphoribosyl-ATP diphosphatase [Parachitinimonas caeni]MDK2123143.1 phosphoribosyl-ATP diphosphatase [Parachitinimonas caeni]
MIDVKILERIANTLESRKAADPTASYVSSLFSKGQDAILKKVGEEAVETIMAAKDEDALHLVREIADLWFHSMILLSFKGLGPSDVLAELARREGISGIEEKLGRMEIKE